MHLFSVDREEIEARDEIIAQLEDERKTLMKKIARIEKEMKEEQNLHDKAQSRINDLQSRLTQVGGIRKKNTRQKLINHIHL